MLREGCDRTGRPIWTYITGTLVTLEGPGTLINPLALSKPNTGERAPCKLQNSYYMRELQIPTNGIVPPFRQIMTYVTQQDLQTTSTLIQTTSVKYEKGTEYL